MQTPVLLSTRSKGRVPAQRIGAAAQGRRGLGFFDVLVRDATRHAAWKLHADGSLRDGQAPHVFLAAGPGGGVLLRHETPGHTVPDRWKVEGGRLVHVETGRILTVVRDGDAPRALRLASPTVPGDDDAPVSAVSLDIITNILAGPGTDFTPFTDPGTAAAYAYVMTQLQFGVSPQPTDIRPLYADLSISLDSAASWLSAPEHPCPPGVDFSQAELDVVVSTLSAEVACCNNVRGLYDQYRDFASAVFSKKDATLSDIQQALDIDDDQGCSLNIPNFLEGILYTVVSTMGEEGSFIANLLAAGYSAAFGSTISTQPAEVLFCDILSTLITTSDQLDQTLDQQETCILGNWGYMQAVSNQCGPGGALAISPDAPGDAVVQGQLGFGVGVMQTVLPAIAVVSIWPYMQNSDSNMPTAPGANTWVLPNGWGNRSTVFTIGYSEIAPISSDIIQDYVWAAGVVQEDFWLNLGLWSIPRIWRLDCTGYIGSGETNQDAAFLILFLNESDLALTVNTVGSDDQLNFVPQSVPLPANGLAMVGAWYNWGPKLDIAVWSPSYTAGSIGSFQMAETVGAWKGGVLSVVDGSFHVVAGWQLVISIQNQPTYDGSGEPGTPGIALCYAVPPPA